MCTLDATCVWSNIRSDLLNNSWGNKRHKLANAEEQKHTSRWVCKWRRLDFKFLKLSQGPILQMQHLIVCWKFLQKSVGEFPSLCLVSLQARHSVNPGFSVPRTSRQVSCWCPVVSVVVCPRERSSGGWELMIFIRWRCFASIFTMRWSLLIAT